MSQALKILIQEGPVRKRTRKQMLELLQAPIYDDGRTKQSFRDECDINLIMQRAAAGGTISHLTKYEGTYSDYSDYDFFEQTQMLTKGREIFDDLPAEIRREFGQSPQAFFTFVNDAANKDQLEQLLPGLAKPGDQLMQITPPSADQAAAAAASEAPPSETPPPPPPEPTPDP